MAYIAGLSFFVDSSIIPYVVFDGERVSRVDPETNDCSDCRLKVRWSLAHIRVKRLTSLARAIPTREGANRVSEKLEYSAQGSANQLMEVMHAGFAQRVESSGDV